MKSSPPTAISQDFRDMLGLLLKNGVEFLLVGGHALAAHDQPRFTRDIDFLVRPSPKNARQLWRALQEFGAPLDQLTQEDFTLPQRVVQFGVDPNRVDFVMSIDGVSFEEAWKDRIYVEFAGHQVPTLSRKHLIQNKQAVGRPKDLADIQALTAESPLPAGNKTRRKPK